MPPQPDGRRLVLPLLTSRRANATCRYRCGDQCSHQPPNQSANEYFGDLLRRTVDRRGLFRAGAVVAVGGAVVGTGATCAAAGSEASGGGARGLDFTPIRPNTEDAVVVPEGYEQGVVIRWDDPILPGAPEFDFDAQAPEAQEGQFGCNNDFCALLPLPDGHRLMVNNHEYTSEEFLFRGYDAENPTEEQVRIAWAAHGLSMVVLDTGEGVPRVVRDRLNRRITLNTPFELRGPAAGSDLLKTPPIPPVRPRSAR